MRLLLLKFFVGMLLVSATAHATTLMVAAHDAAANSKTAADYVCDGNGDQAEINAAIQALPEAGGTVQLTEGTFDIRREEGKLGGVLIERSNVTLAGQGTSTKLIQAPEQETNVIRIIGSGVGYVTIRDLYVDANRDANPLGEGDPNVSHGRFEFCGIKAFRTFPGGPSGEDTHHITIRDCHVINARRLGIMLEGPNMRIIDNVLGNANSDVVEILTGPGVIRGNYAEITGRTHVAYGSDRGSNIIMADNTVHVKSDGDIDIGFRSWANSKHHAINGNVIRVEAGGKLGRAMDIRGTETAVTGNSVFNHADNPSLPLYIRGGNTVLTGNVFENMTLIVDDETSSNRPVIVKNNILENTTIEHRRGNLNPN